MNEIERIAAVRTVVGKSCLLLDDEKFSEWLDLCAPDFHYELQAHSHEIRKTVTWLSLDKEGMHSLLGKLKTHERPVEQFTRHPSVLEVDASQAERISVTTSVLVFRTSALGATDLFAALRYADTFDVHAGGVRLLARRVVMATRVFTSEAGGSHLPM